MRRWTDNHGEDGIRRKFDVYKPCDGTHGEHGSVYPPAARLGADGEFVVVLRPETDGEAVAALELYARLVLARAPVFAAQMRLELRRIRLENEPCVLCGAGRFGRCNLPDKYDSCPHDCSPER